MPTLSRLSAPRRKRHPSQDPKQASGRTRSGNAFYHSTAWRKLRKQVLLEEPDCRICLSSQTVTAATEVDHITPVRLGGDALKRSNCQALCASCHATKSAKERYQKA